MRKKILKKIIILTIIIIIIIVGLLIYIKQQNNNNSELETSEVDEHEDTTFDYMVTEDYVEFYTMSDCVSTYIDMLNVKRYSYYGYDSDGNYTIVVSDEEINENIYNLLSEEYIENNEITIDNLRDKIEVFDRIVNFTPLNMMVSVEENTEKYLIYGILTDTEINLVNEIYIFVNWDVSNNTFSIEPIDGQEYSSIEDIEIINKNKSIAENDLNSVISAEVTYEYMANQYFETYQKLMLTLPEVAYKYLDEEYSKLRFETYDAFIEYIEEQEETIKNTILNKYEVNEENGEENIIITTVDLNSNVYTFEISAIMDFVVQLDDYTIPTDEFIELYDSATDEEKVQTNIATFFKMINTKDYNAAYEILNDTFKANNFATVDEFREYAQNNFFDNTTITTVNELTESGGYYVCTITTSSGSSSAAEFGEETFIVSLGEDTDFEMSFTVKE